MQRLLGTLFFGIFLLSSLSAQEDVAQLLYRQGIAKFVKRDFSGAAEDLERAYRLAPQETKIRDMLRNSHVRQGSLEYTENNLVQAKERYQKALELGPDEAQKKQILDLLKEIDGKLNPKPANTTLTNTATPSGTSPTDQTSGTAQTNTAVPGTATPGTTPPGNPIPGTGIPSGTSPTGTSLTGALAAPAGIPQGTYYIMAPANQGDKALEEFVKEQNKATSELVTQVLATQKIEREALTQGFASLVESQKTDRDDFKGLLSAILIGALVLVVFIILTMVILVLASRSKQKKYEDPFGYKTISGVATPVLESITQSERLLELQSGLAKGEKDWDQVSGLLGELNADVKNEILALVEKKLAQPGGESTGALEVLLPLITDSDSGVRNRSKALAGSLTSGSSTGHRTDSLALEDGTCPDETPAPSLEYLKQLAGMVHTKTGRPGSPFQTADLAAQLAEMLDDPELPPELAYQVTLVHDVGYLELPNSVFTQAELTQEEHLLIRSHAQRGLELLKMSCLPEVFRDGILYHHERMDGSGYPEGLRGSEIPKIARLVAVVDFFVAVTSVRPQRQPLTIPQCLDMMKKAAGTLLDRDMVDKLVFLFEGVDV